MRAVRLVLIGLNVVTYCLTISISGINTWLDCYNVASSFQISCISYIQPRWWSQAAQVIQSYGTSISGYGLIFLGAHFVWAFSLMFLYSGRGYWQELIESIVWAHHKLKIIPHIQPRALSISQGRAVAFIHYTLGGIGCTWSFFISRMVLLNN